MVSGAPELAVGIRSASGLMWTAPSNFVINARYEIDESESEVAQSCPTLWDPMDCSLPGSSLHGILQARVFEWVAISFSRGSSRPRDWICVSHIPGRRFNLWATREAPDWWNWWTHPQIQFVKLTGHIQEKHHLVKMRNTGGTCHMESPTMCQTESCYPQGIHWSEGSVWQAFWKEMWCSWAKGNIELGLTAKKTS